MERHRPFSRRAPAIWDQTTFPPAIPGGSLDNTTNQDYDLTAALCWPRGGDRAGFSLVGSVSPPGQHPGALLSQPHVPVGHPLGGSVEGVATQRALMFSDKLVTASSKPGLFCRKVKESLVKRARDMSQACHWSRGKHLHERDKSLEGGGREPEP